jgi:hypothetical protein
MNNLRTGNRSGSSGVISEPGNVRSQEAPLLSKDLHRIQGNHSPELINDWQTLIKRRRSMVTRNKKIALGSALTCLVALLSLPFVLTGEYSRVSSPDGRFYAVATFPIWQRYVPMLPGQSGDKSGCMALYTADGRSCGRVPVEMVSFIRDLEWGTNRAEIPLVAEWDLSKGRAYRCQ